MTPARGRCLVRKVETSESYAGSKIVLPEAVREKIAAQQVEVVAVGEDAECRELETCERRHGLDRRAANLLAVHPLPFTLHPFHVKPGAWVVIAPRSLVESGEPDTYLVRHDDVLAILSPD